MQKTQSTIRYRIRNKDALLRESFFPWGLLGLLLILLPLLYALFWYARHEIQNTVQVEIKKELTSKNLEWVEVDVDGQAVMLTGQGSKQEGDRAISIAKKVKNAAWMGRFSVPSKVNGRFSEPTTPEPVAAIAAPVTTPIENEELVKAKLDWGRLIAQLDSGVLTLTGTVGSESEKVSLLEVANSKIDPPKISKIVDELDVSELSLNPASEPLAKRVNNLISNCRRGQASSIDGIFSLQCQAKRDQVANLESLAREPLSGVTIGRIQVSSSDDCNESFAKILDGKSIRFSIGSANLKATSAPLLDQVADLAKSCSGLIRVEGHTDKSGNLDANMKLSDARAKAVLEALVQRGVKRERLSPKGFGPTRPRVEGDTPVAYALNRRIEFHVSQLEED